MLLTDYDFISISTSSYGCYYDMYLDRIYSHVLSSCLINKCYGDRGVNSAIIGQIMRTKISANLAVIGLDNVLSPALRQSILSTHAVLM